MHRRWVAGALATAACSLATDLTDLTDGSGPDVGTVDAADATPTPDVVEEPVVDGGRFCGPYIEAGSGLVYCEDFDEPDGAININVIATNGGSFVVDTGDFTSPPASMLTTIPPADASTTRAYGRHDISAAPSIVTCDVDVKLLTSGSAYQNVVSVLLAAPANYQMVVQMFPGGGQLQENTPTADGGSLITSHPFISFDWGTSWHHLQIIIDLKTNTSTFAIDGTNYEANRALVPGWTKGLFTVLLGLLHEDPPAGGWQLRADNLLVQLSL